MTAPAKLSQPSPTRRSCTKSTKIIWAISLLNIGLVVLLFWAIGHYRESSFDFNDIAEQAGVISKEQEDSYIVTEEWLGVNLYRVSTYSKLEDSSNYRVTLLRLNSPKNESFEELVELFNTTPLTLYNNYDISEGVNCQGMTYYIASWCVQTGHVYTINYTQHHTNIVVENKGEWYKFDFTDEREIIKVEY